MEKLMRKGRKVKKQAGGYLIGPSHEQGGIPAYVPGQPPIELEGNEFIINAKTVNAVGVDFLEKLNRTQSPYHSQPGFSQGQLPGSKFKNGGSIRRNNMRRRRKFQTGGHTHGDFQTMVSWTGSPGTYHSHWIPNVASGSMGTHQHPSSLPRPRPRSMGHGGTMRNGNGCPPGMHMMPDGSCMEGAYHGANGSYRHGGPHRIPGTGGPGMPPPRIPDIMGGRRRNSRVRRANMMYAHGGMHRNGCAPGEYCHGGYHNGMRRGGIPRMYMTGGGVHAGSPNSCKDGYGNNVPC
tara:strand:+ start:291 stop:1166 length:876 start_codon:yes stop_codon:yes gene_type:complete